MPSDGVRGRRAVTGLLAGVPLWVRLVAIACCLVAGGAGIIGLGCALAARDSLMWQADQQLRSYAALLASRPFRAMPAGPGPDEPAGGAFVIEVVSAGQVLMRTGADPRPGPALARIPVRAGQLATVPASSGAGSWLVVGEPVHYDAQRILFTYGSDGYYLNVTSTARPGAAGTLVVGLDLHGVGQEIRTLAVGGAVVGGAAVLAVAVFGTAVLRAILRPLARMRKTAAGVVARGLACRLPDDHPRGLAGGLSRSVDSVLTEIGHARVSADAATGSSERMRTVLAGTCQELRRAASIVRGCTEYYRERGPLTAREVDRMMGRVAAEAARMDALIDDLADGRARQQ